MEKDLDKKLYNDYLNGEKEAFEFLYNKYKSRIEYFVYNIVKDYQKAEDITQETFLSIMQNKFDMKYSFKYHIYLIAKSKSINYINVENRRNEIAEMYLLNKNDVEKDVLEILEKEESRKELIDSISLLDEKYRNAIYLVNIEGLSYMETSQILGQTLQNTKNLIHRGKKELRKILLKKGFDEMNKVSKVVVIVVCTGILLTGVVYATNYIIEKIFKKPEIMTYQESIKVDDEEKKKLISEEKAKEIAINQIKERFKKDVGNINKTTLMKDSSSYEPIWTITFDNNISIDLNAMTGKTVGLTDFSIKDEDVKQELSKDEAKQVLMELYSSLGYKEDEYDLVAFNKSNVSDSSCMYQADFSKKYNNIYNDYQTLRLLIIPEKKHISIFTLFDYKFDNNEIILTKEQAIEIAREKHISLGYSNIDDNNISTELKIVKLNDFIYSKENKIDTNLEIDVEDDYLVYVVEPVVRFGWQVKIESEIYYIDTTTGEIIGGDSTAKSTDVDNVNTLIKDNSSNITKEETIKQEKTNVQSIKDTKNEDIKNNSSNKQNISSNSTNSQIISFEGTIKNIMNEECVSIELENSSSSVDSKYILVKYEANKGYTIGKKVKGKFKGEVTKSFPQNVDLISIEVLN